MSTTMPKRIQRKRTKGWRTPEGAVYVGRGSKWGNPWKVGDCTGASINGPHYATAQDCVDLFGFWACDPDDPLDVSPLAGKDLMCWCALDQPCHADVLLELANK
jgi:hypothetical protein